VAYTHARNRTVDLGLYRSYLQIDLPIPTVSTCHLCKKVYVTGLEPVTPALKEQALCH